MEKQLLQLRPSDVLTKNIIARTTSLDVNKAEDILIELFKEKKLQIIIRIECINDEPHFIWLNSLEEYYGFNSDSTCPECGLPYDLKNAKVGFKRGIYR